MKFIAEIRAVGFRDWCWFVLLLKRNEFHPRLGLLYYYKRYPGKPMKEWVLFLVKDRERAHHIDMILSDLKYKG